MEDRVRAIVAASIETQGQLVERAADVAAIAGAVADTLRGGGTILLCGNGGSAADAQHLAAEFVVRLRPTFNRRSLPALALAGDAPLLTAAANDLGFEHVFARLVEALGRPGDLLVAFTTSGRSANVVRALEIARAAGIRTVGLLGGDGGPALPHCDLALTVAGADPGRIQEAHMLAAHAVVECAEELLLASGDLSR